MNTLLPDQLIAIHNALVAVAIPHAFGGAIAFAYYGEPRATHDIDVNIFLPSDHASRVLDSLSTVFPIAQRERVEGQLLHTAQARLRWEYVPVDLFFSNSPFHDEMAARSRVVDFAGVKIPVLSAEDLILCKSAYDRPRDWIDIENMFQIQRQDIDGEYLRRWLNEFFEPDDERARKLEGFIRKYGGPAVPERD